ncbi:beta-N-acetylhexosaminidase [Tamlana sp. 2201CG12-4]|uniref:beta-N-acetylhexosaminidase n=1 Tax=Tamlana sp. 2201CG12-4 TaxID=3112582 RepID=UPI002DBB1A21|nr:beta-N-acetylhexosaminidase [Tamlana sp. 2201CG12-4]MEC3907217.1 beta-N-acetylhexosaminidase [Tamlana sp. 2201CG12-4]
MKYFKILMLVIVFLSSDYILAQKELAIVPKPVKVDVLKGNFVLNSKTQIKAPFQLNEEAQCFKDRLTTATGIELKSFTLSNNSFIELKVDGSLQNKFGNEAYQLKITQDKIIVTGGSKTGVFYGLQTLLQLMPERVFSRVNLELEEIAVPCVEILDYPRFGWRGFMLDASRSFQPINYVKKSLDLMAMHKMNVLHWHLTDDHGWRIEIKSHPELTQVGAYRNQPNYPVKGETNPYGGFYTQEQIRELIKYAAERHITIVPEVDLPGHSSALLEAIPEMACDHVEKQKYVQYFRDYPMRNTNYIRHQGTNVVCAGKDSVYPIIEDIINELIDLFPSKYIHVGGDEVQKKWWEACPDCKEKAKKEGLKNSDELQAYFIKRLEEMVVAHDRKLIGWDEILEGNLSPTASVMGWRGLQGAEKSVKEGRNTIVASNQGYYIQRNQTENPFHPQGWPRVNTTKSIYEYNPIPEGLTKKEETLILGIQTSVWTPFMHKNDLWDIALYPRNCALSEAAWTQKELKNWSGFEIRMRRHLKRLNYQGVSYWREQSEAIGEWGTSDLWNETTLLKYDVTNKIQEAGVYFFLGDLTEGAELVVEEARVLKDGKPISSDKHLGYISKERNHERLYFIDIQSVDRDAQYEINLKVKGTLGKVSKGKFYVLKP